MTAQPPTVAVAANAPAPLSDWSGWWGHGAPLPDEWRRNPPPLKPEVAALRAARMADADPDLLRYCRPLQFTGSSRPLPNDPDPTNTGEPGSGRQRFDMTPPPDLPPPPAR